jgi:protein-S-isoprenylcysteine O-methyltransferase Ste14
MPLLLFFDIRCVRTRLSPPLPLDPPAAWVSLLASALAALLAVLCSLAHGGDGRSEFSAAPWMVWVIVILGVVLNLLAPLIEEAWLEERFGERYLAYKRRAPRFIGRSSTT